MKVLVKSVVAGLIAVGASAAYATPIPSLSALGQTTSSVAGVTTIDFSSGCGYATCSGDFQILSGSASGLYAQPAGAEAPFLSVPNPTSSGTAAFTLGTQANYFGLFWGSIDAYNSIAFYRGGNLLNTFTGTDLVGAQYADGDQVDMNSNRYINFDFGSDTFDEVRLTSTNYAFESDNHAYRAVNVPEPGTLALFALGLLGVAVTTRRRATAV